MFFCFLFVCFDKYPELELLDRKIVLVFNFVLTGLPKYLQGGGRWLEVSRTGLLLILGYNRQRVKGVWKS